MLAIYFPLRDIKFVKFITTTCAHELFAMMMSSFEQSNRFFAVSLIRDIDYIKWNWHKSYFLEILELQSSMIFIETTRELIAFNNFKQEK